MVKPSHSLPRRIVVISQLFYPEMVSTGQTLTELIEALARRGLDITVIASQPTVIPGSPKVTRRMNHAGINILRTWSTRLPKKSTVGKLLNLLTFFLSAIWEVLWHHRDAHLLLQSNPPFLPILGGFFHLLRGQTFGVMLADIMPEQAELLNFIPPNGWIARLWRRFNQFWFERASYVVVFGEDMRTGALANCNQLGRPNEAVARERIVIIPLWADLNSVQPIEKSESSEARRLGVVNSFVIQYSGNHGRFHDLETLIGLVDVFSPDDNVVFQFIGDGQKKRMVQEIHDSGSKPHLYSSFYVPRELLPHSLGMADLGVVAQLPGQERVCYPSKMLGLLAAGRPILAVCPPNCELARFVQDQEIGFVVPNNDLVTGRKVILEARKHPQRLRHMEANARRLAQAMNLEQTADTYTRLIRRFIQPQVEVTR